MTRPLAYEPQQGYMFQILVKTPYDRAYESLDYATDKADKNHLLTEYKMAFGKDHTFKVIELPQKYWKVQKYTELKKELENKGYKVISYSDNIKGQGIAYFETETSVLKVTYKWEQIEDNSYKASDVISVDDVTESYK